MAKKKKKVNLILIIFFILIIVGVGFLAYNSYLQQSWWREIQEPYVIHKVQITGFVNDKAQDNPTILNPPVCVVPDIKGSLSPQDVFSTCGATRGTFTMPDINSNDILFLGFGIYATPEDGADVNFITDSNCDYTTLEGEGIVPSNEEKFNCFKTQQLRGGTGLPKGGSYNDQTSIYAYYEFDIDSSDDGLTSEAKTIMPNTQHTVDIFTRGSSNIKIDENQIYVIIYEKVQCKVNSDCPSNSLCIENKCILDEDNSGTIEPNEETQITDEQIEQDIRKSSYNWLGLAGILIVIGLLIIIFVGVSKKKK